MRWYPANNFLAPSVTATLRQCLERASKSTIQPSSCRLRVVRSRNFQEYLKALVWSVLSRPDLLARRRGGRSDVLPTGQAISTPSTSRSLCLRRRPGILGQKSAELLIKRSPAGAMASGQRSMGLSAWGTSNMRTGGDDIARRFALIGAKPVWDHASTTGDRL